MDEYGGSPYASDWSLGATLGSMGIIFVGEIPADLSQPYTPPPGWEWGFGIVPAPDPASYVTPHPVESTPVPPGSVVTEPPTTPTVIGDGGSTDPGGLSTPPYYGGPEDLPPPDFDAPPVEQPLPTEPPAASLPATVPPPIEGELVGPDIVYHDYEGYDQLPDPRDNFPDPPKRIIEGEAQRVPSYDTPFPFSLPPIITRRLGPIGAAVSIWDFSEDVRRRLGDRFPPELSPIPQITIPPPSVSLPEPTFPSTPDPPYTPEFGRPDVPDVVVVTPPEPLPAPSVPRSLQTPRPRGILRPIWPALGALAPILRPKHRGRGQPRQAIEQILQTFFEANPVTPLPASHASETLPRGVTIPSTIEAPEDLTAPLGTPVPLPGPFGPLQFLTPTDTTEDNDRCKCKKNEKHEPDPSDVVANVKVYKRRMSNWSLKNLNRGTKAANALKRFL